MTNTFFTPHNKCRQFAPSGPGGWTRRFAARLCGQRYASSNSSRR